MVIRRKNASSMDTSEQTADNVESGEPSTADNAESGEPSTADRPAMTYTEAANAGVPVFMASDSPTERPKRKCRSSLTPKLLANAGGYLSEFTSV